MNPIISSGLLAASMLVGQPSESPIAPAGPTVQGKPMTPPSRPILGWFNRDDRPIINRIQTWWKKDSTEAQPTRNVPNRETPPPIIVPAPTPTPNDFPRKLPNPSTKAQGSSEAVAAELAGGTKSEVQQVTLQQTVVTKNKSPIRSQFSEKIGRDEKFEWVTGQLEVENGNYVLYYATPETVDKYHGRIVLVPEKVDLNQFRKGDLVSVRGQLMQRQTIQGIVPTYRTTHAALLERPKA